MQACIEYCLPSDYKVILGSNGDKPSILAVDENNSEIEVSIISNRIMRYRVADKSVVFKFSCYLRKNEYDDPIGCTVCIQNYRSFIFHFDDGESLICNIDSEIESVFSFCNGIIFQTSRSCEILYLKSAMSIPMELFLDISAQPGKSWYLSGVHDPTKHVILTDQKFTVCLLCSFDKPDNVFTEEFEKINSSPRSSEKGSQYINKSLHNTSYDAKRLLNTKGRKSPSKRSDYFLRQSNNSPTRLSSVSSRDSCSNSPRNFCAIRDPSSISLRNILSLAISDLGIKNVLDIEISLHGDADYWGYLIIDIRNNANFSFKRNILNFNSARMLEDFKTVDLDPILSQSSSAKVFYKSVSYGTASTFEYGDGIRNISFPFSLFQVEVDEHFYFGLVMGKDILVQLSSLEGLSLYCGYSVLSLDFNIELDHLAAPNHEVCSSFFSAAPSTHKTATLNPSSNRLLIRHSSSDYICSLKIFPLSFPNQCGLRCLLIKCLSIFDVSIADRLAAYFFMILHENNFDEMRSIQLILDGLIGSSFENFLITHVRNDIILKSSLPLELFQNQVWIAVSECYSDVVSNPLMVAQVKEFWSSIHDCLNQATISMDRQRSLSLSEGVAAWKFFEDLSLPSGLKCYQRVLNFLTEKLRAGKSPERAMENGVDSPFSSFAMGFDLLSRDDTILVEFLNLLSSCLERRISMLLELPTDLQYFVEMLLLYFQKNPSCAWPYDWLERMGRKDVILSRSYNGPWNQHRSYFHRHNVHLMNPLRIANDHVHSHSPGSRESSSGLGQSQASFSADGLLEVEKISILRFSSDERVHEVCRMLCSSRPLYVRVDKVGDSNDVSNRHAIQMKLLQLTKRSVAQCIGRGMLTMSTVEPQVAEALAMPVLSLQGRLPPNNALITMDSTYSSSAIQWPEFHDGVAAGLRLYDHQWSGDGGMQHSTPIVSRNWILYNKHNMLYNSTNADGSVDANESKHGGFLMALGLKGMLNVLSIQDICDYLTRGNEFITVGILLGTAASKLGSADSILSKSLCLHLPSLLPPQRYDIEIAPSMQCAALAGLGLLHCGSGHRLMIEYLLSELTKAPPSDRFDTRESIALASSWALGMILLGKSQNLVEMQGIQDLDIEDRLQLLIDGGTRPANSSIFANSNELSESKGAKILETDAINISVTAPGAILALSMMYMKTKNQAILERINVPQSVYLLLSQRVDILLFRALGISLILWDDINPSSEWIENQLPKVIHQCLNGENGGESQRNFPKECALAMRICILTGYHLGLGLIYAGTCHDAAKNTILSFLEYLQKLRDNKIKEWKFLEKSSKALIEMCCCTTALALGSCCAGSGDVAALRILRELRWKIDDVNYGSHMAIAMALGLVVLSGGNASLKRDPVSISCLLLSFLPRFPSSSVENQFHLQAFRHFYAMAVENRALYVLDADTGESIPTKVEVKMKNGSVISATAPCLLPELSLISGFQVYETKEYFGASAKLKFPKILSSRKPSIIDSFGVSRFSVEPLFLQRKYFSDCKHVGNLNYSRLRRLATSAIDVEGEFSQCSYFASMINFACCDL